MTTQHTQGEWVIEKYSDGYGISREVDGDLESICAMSKIDDEEQVANLIAARAEAVGGFGIRSVALCRTN